MKTNIIMGLILVAGSSDPVGAQVRWERQLGGGAFAHTQLALAPFVSTLQVEFALARKPNDASTSLVNFSPAAIPVLRSADREEFAISVSESAGSDLEQNMPGDQWPGFGVVPSSDLPATSADAFAASLARASAHLPPTDLSLGLISGGGATALGREWSPLELSIFGIVGVGTLALGIWAAWRGRRRRSHRHGRHRVHGYHALHQR